MYHQEGSIKSLFEIAEAYGKTTYELSKLKLLKATIIVISSLVSRLAVILTLTLFTLVLNIGIALLLGELLGHLYYGFFIVAVLYLIAGVIMHFFLYQWIKKPISKLIIKQVLH